MRDATKEYNSHTTAQVNEKFHALLREHGVRSYNVRRARAFVVHRKTRFRDYGKGAYGVHVEGLHAVFHPMSGLPMGTGIVMRFGAL